MSLEGNAKAGYVLEGKITGIPRVDDTLTKDGWCADAKVTGDRLAALEGYKDDALEAAQTATSAAQIAQSSAESAKQYAGERFDELAEDVETLKADVEDLKLNGGGSGGGGDNPGGGTVDASIVEKVDAIEMRVESVEGDMSLYTQKTDSIEQRVEGTENDMSIVEQKVDSIKFEVSDPINGGANRYVTLKLTVGNNAYTGVVMIDGNVDVSGQLSAEALYATLGDIARLRVDSLSTSRRIPMYLASDMSDDNYIDIQEQHITLRRAWTNGSVEQARDDFGALLYWEQDVAGATLGSDGYPEVDGARVFITTEETDWPVTVYKYESGDRLKVFFDEDNNYGPRMIWGEGASDGTEKGRGFIEKLGLSFDIYNHGTDGVKRGIFMGNQYTDIVGERRLSKASASGDNLTLTFEGGVTKKLTFGKNASGNYTSVTCDGFTTVLEGF